MYAKIAKPMKTFDKIEMHLAAKQELSTSNTKNEIEQTLTNDYKRKRKAIN